ncbi:2OG-Fe dioxygenase family protein [Streptomyces sp. TP-A0356]|uniref:2OG-Fe dioxygenase family protein n=1 Tax=Streptomyces sp. TP-A0356 TaxID=1359208 RepID=UPI0006E41009|nr:2OG-Fe dioxygenase family protein [Streptomyces sp. TP-A0356]
MPLPEPGFVLVDLPPVPAALLDSYGDLPSADGSGHRGPFRVSMSWTADDDWFFEVDGARATAGRRAAAARPFASGLTTLLRRLLGGPWLDVSADWHIDTHQLRTVVAPGAPVRVSLPRLDGCELLLFAVVRQEGVAGGGPRLVRTGEPEPCREVEPPPVRALLADCRAVTQGLCELRATGPLPGVQDLLVGLVSRHSAGAASAAA